MPMRKVNDPKPLADVIATHGGFLPAGRWQALTEGQAIATPAKRRPAASTLHIHTARAVIGLASGEYQLGFVAGAEAAFTLRSRINGREERIVHRMRDNELRSSGVLNQSPNVAALAAVELLALRRSPDLLDAYAALLAGMSGGLPDEQLLNLAATASDELAFSIERDETGFDRAVWNALAQATDQPELADPTSLDLAPLLVTGAAFDAHAAGEQAAGFETLYLRATVPGRRSEEIVVDPTGFVGDQLARAVRYMRSTDFEGNPLHVLHYGPTGTGKTKVWSLAMVELDPTFDFATYPYRIAGSGGVEDRDFRGAILPVEGEGATHAWVYGPLVRAMRDGKRLLVDEFNRLPTAMANVLLNAMQERSITIPEKGNEVIVAAPGFAVDATANVGQEYTGTDAIDPALKSRFGVKVRYDFLEPDYEIALLRSRFSKLSAEDAETLVRIAGSIREAYEYGGGGDLDVEFPVSTRTLLHTANLVANLELSLAEAISDTLLPEVASTREKQERVMMVVDQHLRDRRR
jgi:MoxR-like ATPase